MTEETIVGPDEMMEHASDAEAFLKQFANKTRLMVLCSLLKQEKSVTELLEVVNVSQPVISQHLALLRESQIVTTRREGQTIYYRLADERVEKLIALMYEFFCA